MITTTSLRFVTGDIFMSSCQAIACPVNCVRTLGAGLAKQFHKRFPQCSEAYYDACDTGAMQIGQIAYAETGRENPQYVLYVPTKLHWLNPSKIEYIESAVEELWHWSRSMRLVSLAVPALGCGLGDLLWEDVKPILEKLDGAAPRVLIYKPR